MTSRHRRQPSRALPLDFDVGDEPAAAASKGAASTHGPAGGRSDAAKAGQVGEGQGKKLPPATGGGRMPAPEGAGKGHCDGNDGR
ncbi:hypothetical protein CFC21_038211 [Triticum aestivum]|uniref:Uncharacterized protein n=2 Tax=Triticum aestivum TaxID=4565 RepID=A0A3B6EQ40_WHEAT|nr:uncharacterized protein LOC119273513 [Triticum dicoccoides]XP_044343198.1 uncharacterized protein LOC123063473 [Triticum aestivum]KAF7026076.1 hypothetical protein CFC21_038211 [Triticum aestivum]